MKFTIAIPAFKSKFLYECIESVLVQTFSDFELIIVNDDSPENLESIISQFTDGRIKYYKNEHNYGAENVVSNWNKCLSYAGGEYFVLMGDDDKMDPDYLEEFSKLIEKHPSCNVYHCRTKIIDENSNVLSMTDPRPEIEHVYDSIYERMKGSRIFFISDYLFRTASLRDNGGFYALPLAWASDDISAYIATIEHGIAHTNKPVFLYRQNAQTISSSGKIELKMKAILEEAEWLYNFTNALPKLEEQLIIRNSIRENISIFIQKKKIRTIYASSDNPLKLVAKWIPLRRKYNLSVSELLYAAILCIKENMKVSYSNR